jgi:hypothetical protein
MDSSMTCRAALLILAMCVAVSAQSKYSGPRPPKPDLPYLKHASNLVPTEAGTATEEQKKDDITYVIQGAASSARTPLASPILLVEIEKLAIDRLGLYKLESKNGRRELLTTPKKPAKQIRIEIDKLADKLYKIEVGDSLEAGEYSLSPEGSNQVFCFQVY